MSRFVPNPEVNDDDEVIEFIPESSDSVDINVVAPLLVRMMQENEMDSEIVLYDLDLTIQIEQFCTVEEIVEGFNAAMKQHKATRDVAAPASRKKPKGFGPR